MATTVNLNAIKTGYVKKESAGAVFPTDPSTYYSIYGYRSDNNKSNMMYFRFAEMPRNLRHNVIQSAKLLFNIKRTYNVDIDAYLCESDFDPNTLTYNNRPLPKDTGNYYARGGGTGAATENLWFYVYSGKPDGGACFARYRTVYVQQSGTLYEDRATIRTVLTDGSPSYLQITYDESSAFKSKISYSSSQLTGDVNPTTEKNLTWDLVKDTSSASGYCADETWEQASAEFRYRIQGESTWQTISVTGTTKGVTIPANTFSTGNTYEYQISATDEDGTTTETAIYTFTVPASQVLVTMAPTSGYVNPRNTRIFSWLYQTSVGPYPAGNTSLFWRVTGSDSWTEVQAVYGENSLTIPANTFPVASTIEWYLSGTDSTGYASQTSVYSFSTSAGRVTATPVSPISTVESNNEEITLTWTYSSADGFAPSRFVLYWKLITDDSWTVLTDSATAATSYTAPAYTFTAGEIQWYVLPYNIDGVAGSGDSASFIAYGAPEAPVVSAEAVPYTTVIWQATGQEAYEVQVDGDTYGPYFGTEKQFELPEKLEDGQHTIRVRIIGNYGLWSQYGTAVITVENQPGAEIVLTGTAGTDAALSWTTAASETDFLIYRDDVQIGHTAQTAFTDRLAVGEHRYYIVNRLQSGNYSKSNEITLDIVVTGTFIAALPDGEWLEIRYSMRDQRDPQYEQSAESFYDHIAGNQYPSAIVSGYRENKMTFSALFLAEQEEERKRFESLLGKAVIMKLRDGSVFTAILDNWNKEIRKNHWTAYSFSLRRVEWEDYTDDTE